MTRFVGIRTPDRKSQQARLDYLDEKRRSLPNAIFIGVFDRSCIATAAVEKIVGLDASQREYCQPFRENPALETGVTHAFAAVTGPVNVTQARRLSPDGKDFQGVVAIAMDLSFFDKWLDNLQVGDHDLILIADTRGNLLAQRQGKKSAIQVLENHLG